MNANKQAKVEVVKEIADKIQRSQAVVIAKYDGLTVKEFQTLRNQLREKDVELKVYKNRLFKIAAKEAGIGELETSLTGANVFAFGMSDDISPAKVLAAFAKDHEALELKAGTFEGKVLDAAGINEVATLPSLEEALTMLATSLIGPVRYIGTGLHQLTEGDHLSANGSEAATEEVKAEETKETPTEEVAQEAAPAEEVKEEAPAVEANAEETKVEAPAEEAKAEETETAEAVEKEGE